MSTAQTQQGFPRVNAPLCNADLTCNQVWLQLFISMWNRTGGGQGASTVDALDLAALGESAPTQGSSSPGAGGTGSLVDLLGGGGGSGSSADSSLTSAVMVLGDGPSAIPPADPLTALLAESAPLAGTTGTNTGVTPGTYGDGTHVGQFTVNATGDLTFAANVAITAGGSGTVTSISAGTGITLTPNPITTTGTVAITNTAVAAGTYGDSTHVSEITVNAQGQITNATSVAITGGFPTAYEWNTLDGAMINFQVDPTDGRTITGMNSGNAFMSIRAVSSHNSGKFYFEFLVKQVQTSTGPGIGVGDSTATLTSFCGADTHGWAIYMNGISEHNSVTSPQNTYASGDIVGIAVDFTAVTGSINFYKNNVAQTTAYTGLTLGTMFPMGTMQGNSSWGKGQLRLKASEQTYSPPAGYSSWS